MDRPCELKITGPPDLIEALRVLGLDGDDTKLDIDTRRNLGQLRVDNNLHAQLNFFFLVGGRFEKRTISVDVDRFAVPPRSVQRFVPMTAHLRDR